MELEPAPDKSFRPVQDNRPLIPEPLPVRLIAIADSHLPAASGVEVELDAFYVSMLSFLREEAREGVLVYRADNFRLIFDILEPPIGREDLRPTCIEVTSLGVAEHALIVREIPYERHRGLTVGRETLLLRDPAGNWVTLSERKTLR